jgi:hypothetical protein
MWPWLTAIARASVTRLVRMWLASCQPVTIWVAKSITVARPIRSGLAGGCSPGTVVRL